MIAQFPKAYPDELIYSVISRYHSRSGKAELNRTLEEIYLNKQVRPDFEFINRYNNDAIKWMTRDINMETVIEKHTMYPAYMRFCPVERRKTSFNALVNQSPNWNNLIIIPRSGVRYMRYCPVCAQYDRNNFGETYWHRSHQIQKLNICSKHRCYLKNTEIHLYKKSSPGLHNAEIIIPKKEIEQICQNEKEIALARYIDDVMNSPLSFNCFEPIGMYLHSRLSSQYVNNSGLVRHFTKVYDDFRYYYGEEICIATKEQIQKIFNGYLFDPYFICQMALFEGITVNELVNWSGSIESIELTDLYQSLSQKYDMDFNIISKVGDEVLKYINRQNRVQKKCGPQQKNWIKLDRELYPKVKETVDEIMFCEGRPQRLSVAKIQKKLHLAQKQLDHMPECKKYVLNNMETIESFWAREIVWAVSDIEKKREPMNWKHIRQKTNMRPSNLRNCFDYITDNRVKTVISEIMQGLK